LHRSFYFQIDDPVVLNDWIASIHRDRYEIVRDERDAYHQLQDQFSGEINDATKIMESSAADRERMQNEISRLQNLSNKSKNTIMNAFSHIGVSFIIIIILCLYSHLLIKYTYNYRLHLNRMILIYVVNY
jgi:hypothetical protein